MKPQQQQPILQQEPVVVSSAEICYDNLDNDFDRKVDSRDEECSYITSSTSAFPTPGQAEPVTDEETERGEEEDEHLDDYLLRKKQLRRKDSFVLWYKVHNMYFSVRGVVTKVMPIHVAVIGPGSDILSSECY